MTARGVVSVGRVVSSTWLVRPAMAKRRPRPHDVYPKTKGTFWHFHFGALFFLRHFSKWEFIFALDITCAYLIHQAFWARAYRIWLLGGKNATRGDTLRDHVIAVLYIQLYVYV